MNRVRFFGCVILQLVIFALFTSSAAAQGGIVNFRNQVLPQPPERRVFFPDGITPISGTNYMAQLLYSPSAEGPFFAHPQTARFYSTNSPSLRGYWSGGNRTLTGVASGAPVYLQVRVWNAGFGATPRTFEEAQAQGSYWALSPRFPYIEEFDGGADDKWMKNFIGGSWLLTPIPAQFGSAMRAGADEWRFIVRGYYDWIVIETRTNLAASASWHPVHTNFPPFFYTISTSSRQQQFFRAVGYYNQ